MLWYEGRRLMGKHNNPRVEERGYAHERTHSHKKGRGQEMPNLSI
jgi:hypothetical protein